METPGNDMQANVDVVVTRPVTRELMHLNSEVSDISGVNTALDEAMAQEDDVNIPVSATEKSSEANDSQDKTEKANEGEEKSKEIGRIGETEPTPVVYPSDAIPVQISDNTIKEIDKTESKVLGDDKTAVYEDTQGDRLEASLQVDNNDSEAGNSNPVISECAVSTEGTTESQEEQKILLPSIRKESVLVTEASEASEGDVGEEVAVEAVEDKPVSQHTEIQVKEDGEEKKVVEKKGKPKAPARPIKVDPPTVQQSTTKETEQIEVVPGEKPCDRITKGLVPTMKEGRIEEVLKLSAQIEFHKGVTPLALLSKTRWLVKEGDVTLVPQVIRPFSFLRSLRKTTYHLFLFNDTFLICKKKGKKFVAVNYCKRNLVVIKKATSVESLPEKVRTDTKGKNKVHLTLLENHEKKEENMVLSITECTDREEWIKLFKTPAFSSQQEVVYELWDCPLVKVVHDFEATKPEEMSVRKDEKINVIRKSANGFYEGERISDQMRGFFPISATEELSSEHTTAHQIRKKYDDTTF